MKRKPLIALLIALALIILLIVVFVVSRTAVTPPTVEATEALAMTPAPTEDPNVTISMAYDTSIRFPAEYSEVIVYEQDVSEMSTTEMFNLRIGEQELPLYRIDFGDETAGDWLGVLNTDDCIIPVTYTVFALAEEELNTMSENVQEQYYALMNSISDALNTIAADPRFSADRPIVVGEDTEAKTTYWTLTLPGNMTVVESNENDTYVAMFYGNVAGERTALYTVHIGDNKAESELGLYEIDGVKKPISVGSFDLSEKINWTEDDYSAAYRMMDTINHVIETIMSSEQFSIPSEEPVQAPDAAQ